MTMIRFLLLLLAAFAGIGEGARILAFFPMPAKSHHNVFRPIVNELAVRGHHITFVSPIPIKNPHPNIKLVSIPNGLMDLHGKMNFRDFGKLQAPFVSLFMAQMGIHIGENVYGTKEVQNIIHSTTEKYDVILSESLFIQEPVAAFTHKFNAIGIVLNPLGECSWVNEIAGLPDNPSYMIDFKAITDDHMTFIERLHNTYIAISTILVSYYNLWNCQIQTDKYFNYTGWETRPPLSMLAADNALILLNSHFSVGYSYPKAPHVKEIGGINVDLKNNPLPKDLETFLNGANHGAIYFSFGSNVNVSDVTNNELASSLIKSFSKLKQRVLWKWESDKLPKASANVKFSKWFPQQDILAHKNLKLFITHGGLLSIHEAIYHGVPLVAIPFFGDQPKNVKQITSAGYGVHLEFENITETSMSWAINEVISNPSYAKEAKRRMQLFRDRPMTPLQEAMYWIEYVIKHKNVLQPKSTSMPFYQLHMLDVAFVVLLVVLFVVVVSYKIIKRILCCIFKKSKKKSADSKKKKN